MTTMRGKLGISIFILIGLAFVGVALSPTVLRRFDEGKYRSLFLNTAGVESIASYLNYEGFRTAGLITENGGYVFLTNFDDASFSNTNHLELKQIGNLFVLCGANQSMLDGSTAGLNIVQFMKSSGNEVSVRNVAQLVENYQPIYETVAKRVPLKGRSPARVIEGDEVLFCNIVLKTSAPT